MSVIFSFADIRRPGCEAHTSKNSAECKVVQRSCSFHLLFEVQIQILNCIQRACHELSKFISFFAEGAFVINFTMPIIVDVSKEDLLMMLWDGGLKPATVTSRKRFYDEVFYLLSVL